MQKITLAPGVWMRFEHRSFQPRPDAIVRIAAVTAASPDAIVAPSPSTDAYITNAGVTEHSVNVEDFRKDYFTALYLMPDGSSAVTIIAA